MPGRLNTAQTPSDSGHDNGTQPCRAGILLLAPDAGLRAFLHRALAACHADIVIAESLDDAQRRLHRKVPDLLVLSLASAEAAASWLNRIHAAGLRPPSLVILSPGESVHTASRVADGNLPMPFSAEQLQEAVLQRLKCRPESHDGTRSGISGDPLVSDSASMQTIRSMAERVAPGNTTVLLDGESGTGKEILAAFIHQRSRRRGAFAPINCSAISPDLLESELFGHVRGAFTGAMQNRDGLFVHAHGGTVFLDEIGDMPPDMQAKLLRVLEERRIRPVGAEREIPVDVRIIAATNRSLGNEVAAGRFREDLFYRINVLRLQLPPLRERPSDLPALIGLFSHQLSTRLGLPALVPEEPELVQLQRYHWPGNVREVKNMVERAMVLGQSLSECLYETQPLQQFGRSREQASTQGYPDDFTLAEVERRHILQVLKTCKDNKSEAARRLQVSRKTLERKLKAWAAELPRSTD